MRLSALAVAALGSVSDPMTELSARCVDAAVRFDAGDRQTALRDWCAIWERLGDKYLHPSVAAFGATIQVRMAIEAAEPRLAVEAVDRVRALSVQVAEANLLQAQIHAHEGRPA
jgi:hypothetical protein